MGFVVTWKSTDNSEMTRCGGVLWQEFTMLMAMRSEFVVNTQTDGARHSKVENLRMKSL